MGKIEWAIGRVESLSPVSAPDKKGTLLSSHTIDDAGDDGGLKASIYIRARSAFWLEFSDIKSQSNVEHKIWNFAASVARSIVLSNFT